MFNKPSYLINIKNKSKVAFSIAEAMIALLIGSLILGFTAPVISKQIKYNNMSDVQMQVFNKKIEQLRANQSNIPSGAVMAFNRTSCPDTWTPLTTIIANTEGAFIRNIGGNAGAKGIIQEDAAPNIQGTWVSSADSLNSGNENRWTGAMFHRNLSVRVSNGPGDHDAAHYQVFFDASRSSTVYGRNNATEIRPRNIALLYCVKD